MLTDAAFVAGALLFAFWWALGFRAGVILLGMAVLFYDRWWLIVIAGAMMLLCPDARMRRKITQKRNVAGRVPDRRGEWRVL